MATNPLVFVGLNVYLKYYFCDSVINYDVYDCLCLTGMANFCGVLCPTFDYNYAVICCLLAF
jgi:hypothetical protein